MPGGGRGGGCSLLEGGAVVVVLVLVVLAEGTFWRMEGSEIEVESIRIQRERDRGGLIEAKK